jgi:formylglycine-generating enzyme required for sulfatase activity
MIVVVSILSAAFAFTQETDRKGLEVRVRELGSSAAAGRQYAVLIAIDRYNYWFPLKNPVKDALSIRDILSRRYYVDEFRELYDEEATKEGIIRLFKDLIRTTQPADSVFIFYSGHGHLDTASNTGFWIPVDGGKDEDAQENWIPNSQIRGFISNLKARHAALFSDSCFSGDFLDVNRGAKPGEIGQEYFRNAYGLVSRQVVTSGASETVPDESYFALQLRQALEGNTSTYLDPLMLYGDIRLGVRGTTPLFGSLPSAGHQQGASFLFFLREGSAPPPKSFGSLTIETKTQGTLFLDGQEIMRIPAGSSAKLSRIETGRHSLEMRYDSGATENITAVVEKDKATPLSFIYAEEPEVPRSFVRVPGGTFRMGSEDKPGYGERPVHEIRIGSFIMSAFEVTVGEFRRFVSETGYKTTAETSGGGWVWTGNDWEMKADAKWRNPYFSQTDSHPVVLVSWYDTVEYCNWLSRNEGRDQCYTISGTNVSCDFSRNGYRLPTEAEWEYAARSGGKDYKYSWGNGSPSGNIADERLKKTFSDWSIWDGYDDGYVYTAPVGSFRPNELGLYDITGNVWEWCWDWYDSYDPAVQTDPRGPSSPGVYRVLRGGAWESVPIGLSATYRNNPLPGDRVNDRVGFRVAAGR